MNEDRARLILGGYIQEYDSSERHGWYVSWGTHEKDLALDGRFTPEELEAIAFWMRLKGGQG